MIQISNKRQCLESVVYFFLDRIELRDYACKNILKFDSPREEYEKLELFGQFGMKGPNSEGKEDSSVQVSQLSFVGVIFRLY